MANRPRGEAVGRGYLPPEQEGEEAAAAGGGGDAGDPGDFLECAALPNGYYHNNICHNKIPVYKADPPVTAAPGTFWVRDPAGMDPPPH